MFTAVYFIDNLDNGKFYVGHTEDPVKRERAHLEQLRNGVHHNFLLQEDYDAGDELEFTYFPADNLSHAQEMEDSLVISFMSTGLLYNIGYGKGTKDNLTYHPKRDLIIAKMVRTLRETLDRLGPEAVRRMHSQPGNRNGMYGRTHSPEVRELLSMINRGRESPMKGKRLSTERRERLSEIASGRLGEKNSFYGKTHSEETKAVLREKNKGKLPPNTEPVEINGIQYISATSASRILGIHVTTILHRIKSPNPKFVNYRFTKRSTTRESE